MYSNRVTRSGGPPEWVGRFSSPRNAGEGAKRLIKRHGAPCVVETWWGRDMGADGFNGKLIITTRQAK